MTPSLIGNRNGTLGFLLCCLAGMAECAAAELNSVAAAKSAISAAEMQGHVDVLADDSFEGREAGRSGGRAAGMYLMTALHRDQLQPAGDRGTYFQSFGAGYRNILTVIPGSDPSLRAEYILVCAHYDHVGYGTRRNSNGPTGYIHNGADDNASGSAAVLELAKVFRNLQPTPRRSLLFALWDGEEKGLLGSLHWLEHPTVPLDRLRIMINMDMVGRMRDGQLSVVGSRTMSGLRELISRANVEPPLELSFPWKVTDNSDHHSFYQRRIPALMLHTGLHDDYHRPSDDPHKINAPGMRQVTALALETVHVLANRDELPGFREASLRESTSDRLEYERPPVPPPPRLGISWDDRDEHSSGVVIHTVHAGSAAGQAGLRVGDRIIELEGKPLVDPEALRARVMSAREHVSIKLIREGGQTIALTVPLQGTPLRLGIFWRESDAEPGVVMVSRVVHGSPAARAGLQPGDRVCEINGQRFRDSRQFEQLVADQVGEFEMIVERKGQMRTISLQASSTTI